MSFKLLDAVKPFEGLLPEIEAPFDKVVLDDKIMYTIGAAALYLITSMPLYGVNATKIVDPFYWTRYALASDKGTLLELGLAPVLTSALFWQIMAGSRIVGVNFSASSQRQRFQSLQKLTAIGLGFFYAVLLVLSGYFESVDAFTSETTPSVWRNALIVVQLTAATASTTYLCEILEKGYGFGPGTMALMAVHAATKLSGSIAGIVPSPLAKEPKAEGVLIQLVNNFFKGPFAAVYDAFNRTNEINLTQIYLTLAVGAVILYLSNFRYEISVKSAKVRSMVSTYPIRLLYCGPLPLVFAWTLLYNVFFAAYVVTNTIGEFPLLAKYDTDVLTGRSNVVGGALYLLTPVCGGENVVLNVLRPFVFTLAFVGMATAFSMEWYAMAGSSGKDLARQFKDQEISVVGHRDATVGRELNRLISQASLAGSLILSALVGGAESLGITNGVLSGVSIGLLCGLAILENVVADLQQGGAAGSQFGQVFGGM